MNLHEFLVNFQAGAEKHPLTLSTDDHLSVIRTVEKLSGYPLCPIELASFMQHDEQTVNHWIAIGFNTVEAKHNILASADGDQGFFVGRTDVYGAWRAVLLKLGGLWEYKRDPATYTPRMD